MGRLKDLITSSHYWPEDTGSAPHLTGLVGQLAERGHDVVVATGLAHYPNWQSSARGCFGAEETHNGVRIRRGWHYVASAQPAAQRAAYELSLLALGLTARANALAEYEKFTHWLVNPSRKPSRL